MRHTLNYKTPPRYSTYKTRHMKGGYRSSVIAESVFRELSSKACHYCGLSAPDGPLRYIVIVSRDKFGRDGMQDLTDAQLTMLQHTLAARANARRRKASQSPAAPRPATELDAANAPF